MTCSGVTSQLINAYTAWLLAQRFLRTETASYQVVKARVRGMEPVWLPGWMVASVGGRLKRGGNGPVHVGGSTEGVVVSGVSVRGVATWACAASQWSGRRWLS